VELVSKWTTKEVTYHYEHRLEKELHEALMIRSGFTVVPSSQLPLFMRKDPLKVTYEKRIKNDGIARL